MKILFDFFPIAAFFLAYKWYGIYIATGIAMVASLIQVLWSRKKAGRFEILPLVTLFSILILGGATLLFKNESFIKWKPTVVYWVLSLVFLSSQFVASKKPVMQRLAGDNIALPNVVWRRLNMSWVLFFLVMGVLNLYVMKHYDTNAWVNFKLFGTLGCTLIFIIAQGIYMFKHHAMDLANNKLKPEPLSRPNPANTSTEPTQEN